MARTQSVKIPVDRLIELVEAKKAADVEAHQQAKLDEPTIRGEHARSLNTWIYRVAEHVAKNGRMPEGVGVNTHWNTPDEWKQPVLELPARHDPAPKHDRVLKLLRSAVDSTLKVDLDSDLAAYL